MKLRGQRVELGEIEYQLSAVDAVARSTINLPKNGPFRDGLVAVIQPRNEREKSGKPHKGLLTISNDILSGLDDTVICVRRHLETHLSSYMVPIGDERSRSSIEGRDVLLQATGINSISVVKLASFIKQAFDVNLGVGTLATNSLTVRGLARQIENAKVGVVEAETSTKTDLLRELSEMQKNLLEVIESPRRSGLGSASEIETIFVTGATGYVGTHILTAALLHPQTKRIIAHARAKSAEHGLRRVIYLAKMAGWWADELQSKLD